MTEEQPLTAEEWDEFKRGFESTPPEPGETITVSYKGVLVLVWRHGEEPQWLNRPS